MSSEFKKITINTAGVDLSHFGFGKPSDEICRIQSNNSDLFEMIAKLLSEEFLINFNFEKQFSTEAIVTGKVKKIVKAVVKLDELA